MNEAIEFSVYLYLNWWKIISYDTARNLDTQEIKELTELYNEFKIRNKLEWQAKNKSSSNIALITHTAIYSFFWFIPMIVLCTVKNPNLPKHSAILFVLITFFWHTITDYITSREVKKMFDKGDVHNGFVLIGGDQIAHYIQLFLTYQYITT